MIQQHILKRLVWWLYRGWYRCLLGRYLGLFRQFLLICILSIVLLLMKIKQSLLWIKSFFKTWVLKSFQFIVIFFKFNPIKRMKKISHAEFFINHCLCSNKYHLIFTKPESHLRILRGLNKFKNSRLSLKMISVDPI